jgi:hypothetical protein
MPRPPLAIIEKNVGRQPDPAAVDQALTYLQSLLNQGLLDRDKLMNHLQAGQQGQKIQGDLARSSKSHATVLESSLQTPPPKRQKSDKERGNKFQQSSSRNEGGAVGHASQGTQMGVHSQSQNVTKGKLENALPRKWQKSRFASMQGSREGSASQVRQRQQERVEYTENEKKAAKVSASFNIFRERLLVPLCVHYATNCALTDETWPDYEAPPLHWFISYLILAENAIALCFYFFFCGSMFEVPCAENDTSFKASSRGMLSCLGHHFPTLLWLSLPGTVL